MQQDLYHSLSYQQRVLNTSSVPEVNQFQNSVSCSTPVSSAMYGTTETASWAHTVPAFMPWVSEGNNTNSTDPVVRFTAPFPPDPCTSQTATSWELLNNLGASKTNANLHLKRRIDLDEPEIFPQKQYITEEKMAARMQELHISNQYTIPLENSPFGPYSGDGDKSQKAIKSLQELEVMLSCNSSNKSSGTYKGSIILAPEIKSLVEPEKLFAKTFVNEIERPTMAVVLWKPPQGSIKDIRESHQCLEHDDSCSDSQNNILSSAFLSEKNNNSARSSTQLLERDSLPTVPSSFSHLGTSLQNDDDDFEMEA